jgi:hypothetical protein
MQEDAVATKRSMAHREVGERERLNFIDIPGPVGLWKP